MLSTLKRFLKDEEGPTAVEYGLMVAAVAGVIIAVVFLMGRNVNRTFDNVADQIANPPTS
jgi:pilus assembly protein Flp/PilA